MKLKIISQNKEIRENIQKVEVNVGRIKTIKGDVKVRVEVVREILHNAIDAGANNIKIAVEKKENNKIKLVIKYSGDNLHVFKDTNDIINSLMKADISAKRDDDKTIGGKGIGAKVIFSAGQLEITSTSNGKSDVVRINDASSQIEKIYDKKQEELKVIIEEKKESYDYEKKEIKFILDELFTDDVMSFEHKALIQYLNYFTVLGPISCHKIKEKGISIHIKGLDYDGRYFKNRSDNEYQELKGENRFDYIKSYAKNKDEILKFHYLKSDNGSIESDRNLEKLLNEDEKKQLKKFSQDASLYIFRVQDDIKDIINVRRNQKDYKKYKIKDEDFFGVYVATQGVILNERFKGLPFKNSGKKSGGNLFSQYFGYVYNSKLDSTGNRNNVEANEEYYKFKQELDNVMPIINKILSFEDKNLKKIELKDDNLIQGLWGELRYIYEKPKMIDSWGKRQKHDFEYNNNFSEIKTKIIGDDDKLIRINSIEELDDNINGILKIYYLKKYSNESQIGTNIFEMVEQVMNKLSEDKREKLLKNTGSYLKSRKFKDYYNDIIIEQKEDEYDLSSIKKYSLEKCETYEVDINFPKIKRKMIEENCSVLENGYDLNLDKVRAKGIIPIEERDGVLV